MNIAEHVATGNTRAIKIITKSTLNRISEKADNFLKECKILTSLDHPNILKVYEFWEDDGHYYTVSQIYKGGDLFDYIIAKETLTEVIAAKLMK